MTSGSPGRTPVRWGFLGAGWIAHRALAPAVHCADGAVLHAAGARELARARSLGPLGAAYDSYHGVLDDPAVEAVYVSLSNEAHLPWTLRALEAGKHVLCEKPLGLTADEVRTMHAAARAAGRLVVEATWSRWHPRTRRAQALLATGAIGEVESVEAGFTFPGVSAGNYRLDPERGGGALYDLGPYAVGAALWAVPAATARVISVDTDRHPSGVDLTTVAHLRIGSASVVVRTSIDESEGQWLRIVGERGTLELDSPAFTSWLAPSTLRLLRPSEDLTLHVAAVDAYQVMVEQVSRMIRGDEVSWVLPMAESVQLAETLDRIRDLSR